jgi:hypothetical protein
MKHVSTKSHGVLLLSTVFAAGLAFAQATPAQEASSESLGPYATYLMSVDGMSREQALKAARVIDGHRAVVPELAVEHAPAGAQPGPYASYLMHIGMAREDALKSASMIDRHQVVGSTATAADPLADVEPGPYAKYLVHTGMTREAALSAARTIDQGQRSVPPKFARWPTREDDGAAH